ncbi:methyl-CpG-binding domain protein 3-like isoform X1 [Petromyzon marinus]|uniref:Methyl-CpG-binding domain protein 2-like isoform X1 n=1 Tax=Petromyzon marinus TaxID=7757 RepID=A0AAJ7SQE0_PETMA|nr:methyl-CpG-binding domain protein 2-like isoform X1 [Petromyzon marinus]
MVMCFVPNCRHYSERDSCKFFHFPKTRHEFDKWKKLISRADREPSQHSMVCSCHFPDGKREHGPAVILRSPNTRLLPASDRRLIRGIDPNDPNVKKFRGKPQLARYLGTGADISSFDYRTGKLIPGKLQKNKIRLRNDQIGQGKGKPDLNTSLPIRQTASIFKQPVTKVVNHSSSKVKADPHRAIDQPKQMLSSLWQLFWEKRLQGWSASDITEEILKSMDLPKGIQGVGPGWSAETLLSSLASALHTSSSSITGQMSAGVEKNPAIWLNTSQPLCKAFTVTDDDIRKQEERVQSIRKKLEQVLMADILASAEDIVDDESPLPEKMEED